MQLYSALLASYQDERAATRLQCGTSRLRVHGQFPAFHLQTSNTRRRTACAEAAARVVVALGAEAGAAEGAVVAREAAAAAVVGLGEASEHLRQKEVAVAVAVGAEIAGTFLPTTPLRWAGTLNCHNRRPTDLHPSRTLAIAQDSLRGLVAVEMARAAAAAAERVVAEGVGLEAAGR